MNNTKELNLYGLEKHNEAYAAFQRLQQMGYVTPDNFDITIFRAGFMAAIEADKINKARAADRKAKKFIISDFIDKYLNKYGYQRFMAGVYYDVTEKAAVVTNGNYLVFSHCDNIPVEYENKIIGIDGVEIDGRFPNWKKVVPDNKDVRKLNAADKKAFVDDIFNSDINLNMTLAKCNKYAGPAIAIKNEVAFTPIMIKRLTMFLKTQKNVEVFFHKEGLKDYQAYNERPIIIKGDTATFIAMPCKWTNEVINVA